MERSGAAGRRIPAARGLCRALVACAIVFVTAGCGKSNGDNQGACGSYLDYYNNLPCVEDRDRLDFLTTCPDELRNASCDLSDYYLCLTLATTCVNGQIDDSRTAQCALPCTVASPTATPSATPSGSPTESPSPTASASPSATPSPQPSTSPSPSPSPSTIPSPRAAVQPLGIVVDHIVGSSLCPDRIGTIMVTNRTDLRATVNLEPGSSAIEVDSESFTVQGDDRGQTDVFFDCTTSQSFQDVVDVTVSFPDGVRETYEVGVLVRIQ